MTRSGSPYALPRDADRVPAVGGVKASDGVTVTPFELDGNNNLLVNANNLVNVSYDYIAYTNTSTTVDTYTYKSGGSGGTTVATLTITYTDTTKTQPQSIART